MTEIWKPIPDFEGYYEISNKGRVRSLDRTITYNDGRKSRIKGKVKKPAIVRGGYLQIRLRKNNIRKNYYVHVLVARLFIPNPENLPEVNHKNHIKTDNSVENLEWITHKNNIHDMIKYKIDKGEYKRHICIDCGTPISQQAIRCVICSTENRRKIRYAQANIQYRKKPDKETLKILLTTNSYSAIGQMYHISSNAVKKWAKGYGLYEYCFCQLPNENQFIEYMNTHALFEAKKFYNVSESTIKTWCNKFGINHIKSYKIQCIETNELFESGRSVIRRYLPNAHIKSSAELLRKSIKNGDMFLGYHWIEVLI